jgi:hypothetical protein
LRALRLTRTPATNWRALRAAFLWCRATLLSSARDFEDASQELDAVFRAQNGDGLFEDVPGRSRPVQYHAATLALLWFLFGEGNRDVPVERLLAGSRCLLHFVPPSGDFNHKGRGAGQLFGYGPAVFAMLMAARQGRGTEGRSFGEAGMAVARFLLSHQESDGSFPLVLNLLNHEFRAGWYDYNYPTPYIAYTAAWLALTGKLLDGSHQPQFARAAGPDATLAECAAEVVRREGVYACFANGDEIFTTEPAASPTCLEISHIGPLLRRPGGPNRYPYGLITPQLAIHGTVMGPAVRIGNKWTGLLDARCHTERIGDALSMHATSNWIHLHRRWCFYSRHITISDEVHILRPERCTAMRLFMWPVCTTLFQYQLNRESSRVSVDLQSRAEQARTVRVQVSGMPQHLVVLEERVPSPTGLLDVVGVEEAPSKESRRLEMLITW